MSPEAIRRKVSAAVEIAVRAPEKIGHTRTTHAMSPAQRQAPSVDRPTGPPDGDHKGHDKPSRERHATPPVDADRESFLAAAVQCRTP
jgi:hypothetical protein